MINLEAFSVLHTANIFPEPPLVHALCPDFTLGSDN